MSVLITGMEMPTSCAFCRFNGAYCYAKGDEDAHSTLPCPLVPVPPHGDLIDAQEQMRLMQSYDYDTYDDYNRAFDMLDNAPTIIPSEEEPAKDINVPTTYDLLYEEGGYNSNGV